MTLKQMIKMEEEPRPLFYCPKWLFVFFIFAFGYLYYLKYIK